MIGVQKEAPLAQRVEIVTGKERRRRWSEAEKRQLVAESYREGSSVAQVARRHEVAESCLYIRRKKLVGAGVDRSVEPARPIPVRVEYTPTSIPAQASASASTPIPTRSSNGTSAPCARTMVTLPDGTRVEIEAGYPAAVLKALMMVLRRRVSMPMTPPCRCWRQARPGPAGFGSMCATIGRSPAPTRRRRPTSTRAIAAVPIPSAIWPSMPG